MMRRLLSIALVVAALVALGKWAENMFFPEGDIQDFQARIDELAWDTPQKGDAMPVPIQTPTQESAGHASFREVAPSSSTMTPSSAAPSASPIPNRISASIPATMSTVPTTPTSTIPISAQKAPGEEISVIHVSTGKEEATVAIEGITLAAEKASENVNKNTTVNIIENIAENTATLETMDNAYISGILRGLNDRRISNGSAPLTLNSSLSAMAQTNATNMAQRGDKYHSGYGVPEDASYSHISNTPESIGAKATEHVVAFRDTEKHVSDGTVTIVTKVVSVGIGAVCSGDRVYVCILGEETVEFLTSDTP